MLEDRNLCTHLYDFDTSRRIFTHIDRDYAVAMADVAKRLQARLAAETP